MSSPSILRRALATALGVTHGGRRNTYEVFGYPSTVDSRLLLDTYRRDPMANRIIRAFSQATWREDPVFSDKDGASGNEEEEGFSPFVKAVQDLIEKHSVISALERADRLSSIGRFGILLCGFQDGKPLDQPLEDGHHPLLYLQPYGDPTVSIHQFETDQQSPRYGLPLFYTINQAASADGMKSVPMSSVSRIHYSRVIHLAEFLDEDSVYSTPRLLPVFNRLLDLDKVVGGSAETFFLTADRGIAVWADKEAQLTEDDITTMETKIEEFRNQMRRVLVGTGMQAQVLGSEDPDPGPNAEKLLDLIAGGVGIPKRILIGTERGELSSVQDENNWSARITERRRTYAMGRIVRPFITLMIRTGNLPEPTGMWWAEWQDGSSLSVEQEANVANVRATALATYANSPTAAMIVPPQEFRSEFLGLEPESEYEDVYDEMPDLEEEAPVADEDDGIEKEEEVVVENQAMVRSAYVRRRVLNAQAIAAWAKKNGIEGLVPAKEMHVTVMYSSKAFDWSKAGSAEGELPMMIQPDNMRFLELFGDGDALVLTFTAPELSDRHRALKAMGARPDRPAYRPHVTLSYDLQTGDLARAPAYPGAIALGPEEWSELEGD